MQINGVNYEWLRERVALNSVEELQDPYKNIECGVVLLKDHLNYTGNVYDAVLRYQVGIGSYEEYKRNGWGNEYTDRVMREGERDAREEYRVKYIKIVYFTPNLKGVMTPTM